MNYLTHSQSFIISVDEVDYRERLKISAILQYFQDLATVHALHLGIGYESMKAQNLFWILSRLSFRIVKYPKLGEEIIVATYPRKPRLADAIRDYYIYDKEGELLVSGTSKWCVINGDTHMPKRCEAYFDFNDEQYIPTNAVEDGNQKLPTLINSQEAYQTTVRLTDLDRNIHMNNARYGDIVYNACNMEKLNAYSVKSFDINFLAELKLHDSFAVNKENCDNFTLFDGVRDADGKTVFRAKISWESNENFGL